jgi:hypothetical protein
VDGFLGLLRHVLDLDGIPDYSEVVRSAFDAHITTHNYTGDQVRFLRAVQEIFSTQRELETVDLYESPALGNFGRNAVDRLFSHKEVEELITMNQKLAA